MGLGVRGLGLLDTDSLLHLSRPVGLGPGPDSLSHSSRGAGPGPGSELLGLEFLEFLLHLSRGPGLLGPDSLLHLSRGPGLHFLRIFRRCARLCCSLKCSRRYTHKNQGTVNTIESKIFYVVHNHGIQI